MVPILINICGCITSFFIYCYPMLIQSIHNPLKHLKTKDLTDPPADFGVTTGVGVRFPADNAARCASAGSGGRRCSTGTAP
jgi:hypothetical protein